jgi:hypothetical protein
MFAIVWKSFDMTAELKNWVFEWIGGSPRTMGENDSQQKHIMGAVGTAKSSTESSLGAGARGGKANDDVNKPAPKKDTGISSTPPTGSGEGE